mmetsp:Transcript_9519/g.12918  ORF Transcript_9519/g.12918 Transcript_9519/m.12918 type:complete len:206 (-) Transcript_9519:96-713(-)
MTHATPPISTLSGVWGSPLKVETLSVSKSSDIKFHCAWGSILRWMHRRASLAALRSIASVRCADCASFSVSPSLPNSLLDPLSVLLLLESGLFLCPNLWAPKLSGVTSPTGLGIEPLSSLLLARDLLSVFISLGEYLGEVHVTSCPVRMPPDCVESGSISVAGLCCSASWSLSSLIRLLRAWRLCLAFILISSLGSNPSSSSRRA